jgi:hypothetical protein
VTSSVVPPSGADPAPSSSPEPAPTAATAPHAADASPQAEQAPITEPEEKAPRRSRTPLLVGVLAAAVLALAAALVAVIVTNHNGSSSGPAAAGAATKGTSFTVALASSAEVPSLVASTASGTAEITIKDRSVCWSFDLQGVKQPNAAHIHKGGSDVSGPVVVPLGGAFTRTGCITASAAAVAGILADPAGYYVNVHSEAYPDGVVRGQLKGSTAGQGSATATAPVVVGLAPLVPKPVFENCTVQPTPQAGAVETASCVPKAGQKTFYPSHLELSVFSSTGAALAAYDAARRKADVGTDFGRCDSISWAGEGQWFHAPEGPGQQGKRGGRRFCYFDGNVAVMVWTHEKFGQATHVDLLGIARQVGSDHPSLFTWWRFWHHRIGKCTEPGCVAKPS